MTSDTRVQGQLQSDSSDSSDLSSQEQVGQEGQRTEADENGIEAYIKAIVDNDRMVRTALEKDELGADEVVEKARALLRSPDCSLDADGLDNRLAQSRRRIEEYEERARELRRPPHVALWVSLLVLGFGLLILAIVLLAVTGSFWWPAAPWVLSIGVFFIAGSLENRGAPLLRELEKDQVGALADHERFEGMLTERLRSFAVLPAIRSLAPPTFRDPEEDEVVVADASALSSRTEEADRIETASYREVLLNMRRHGGATVGVAGPRGAGKSELLRAFCDEPSTPASVENGGTVGVIIPSPVVYDADPFLRMVIRRLAERVPGYQEFQERPSKRKTRRRIAGVIIATAVLLGVGLVLYFSPQTPSRKGVAEVILWTAGVLLYVEAFAVSRAGLPALLRKFRRRAPPGPADTDTKTAATRELRAAVPKVATKVVETMRSLETREWQQERSVTAEKVLSLGFKRTSKKTHSALPLTQPDLVQELETLVGQMHEAGYQVVIGIDELDKLEDSPEAREFLNGIKVLFGIRNCSFLVTISDSAWAKFTRRGVDVRDVFDSSLDDTVKVRPMDVFEARSFVRWRDERMSDTQVLFALCLSGGMPRDFLRYCRLIGKVNHKAGGSERFSSVAEAVLRKELVLQVEGAELAARSVTGPRVAEFVADGERLREAVGSNAVLQWCLEMVVDDPEFAAMIRIPTTGAPPRTANGRYVKEERETAGRRQPSSASVEGATTPEEAAPEEDASDALQARRRQLDAYAFFNETLREAFGADGPLSGREAGECDQAADAHAIVDRFAPLVEARQRLELDPAAAWRQTARAREILGLPRVGQRTTQKTRTRLGVAWQIVRGGPLDPDVRQHWR